MNTATRSAAALAAAVLALTVTACGPTQEERDKDAASDVAMKFTTASSYDKCQYDADNENQQAIENCQATRNTEIERTADTAKWEVKAVEPWGNGYAVQLEADWVEVVGLLNIDGSWKVSAYDSTDKAVAAQSDWACQVIGGPDCGGSR